MSLTLRYAEPGGGERSFTLAGDRVAVGRGRDNDLVLSDPSVSRRHCELHRGDGGWRVEDLGSTNGVQVNGVAVRRAPLVSGDRLKVGVFELAVHGAEVPVAEPVTDDGVLGEATIVRRLAEVTGALPLAGESGSASAPVRDPGYGRDVLAALYRLAGSLMRADSLDEVLARVMDAAFEALRVDRGFLFLERDGALACELARYDERSEVRPEGELPVSTTMLRAVVDRRLALVTRDARADERLAGGESILLHQIRAAMCAPLWSGERVVGVIQVDTPFQVESFAEHDLELLTALANYAAVAVERVRNARRAEQERWARARLERYHSPAVVEEVLRRGPPEAGGLRRLRQAEVSVLFADLAGFTTLAEEADPGEVAALLGEFFDSAVEEIFATGGTLDKFIGDCVMAFFGAPVAQADHAARAVRAALGVQRGVAAWNRRRAAAGEPPLAVRVGINSGPVVVGEVGSERRVDYTVLGDTVNVAARLESSVAAPGEVVVGPLTHRLLAGDPATEPLGELRLEGMRRAVAAYRVPVPPAC